MVVELSAVAERNILFTRLANSFDHVTAVTAIQLKEQLVMSEGGVCFVIRKWKERKEAVESFSG